MPSIYASNEEAEDDSPTVHPPAFREFNLAKPPPSSLANIIRRALNCVCTGNSISCAFNMHTVIRPQVSDIID